MIRYNTKLWFKHIFRFTKGDTLIVMYRELIVIGIYTALIAFFETKYVGNIDITIFKNTTTVHSLVGFVIGLLLVFRTNTAYDRWWEGRKQWGALVNCTRNLSLKLNALLPLESTERNFFATGITDYVYSVRDHLRNKISSKGVENKEVMEIIESKNHKPNAIASLLYNKIVSLNKNQTISNEDLRMLDDELKEFTDVTGACERIKNSPIPYSYNNFIKKFIFIYVTTLPLGFVPVFGYWTVPIAIFVFYIFVSLEILAEEIEDPFGTDENDLPIDDLSLKIKQNVDEILCD